MKNINRTNRNTLLILTGITLLSVLESCTPTSGSTGEQMQALSLPVITLESGSATTFREFPGTIEGKQNVEIRPQVDGYLESILVDEGDYVTAGQLLFRINDRPFQEQLLNARAALLAAEANQEIAQLEVVRLTPLVKNNVVAEVQLKSAEAGLQSAKAAVSQARAMLSNAEINLGYTYIKAPANGYIGRIPMKAGSLVGRGEILPLTILSDINEVYAYFSMSEIDFLHFKEAARGNTIEEKLRSLGEVELLLADNSTYEQKGKIETVEGQFNRTTGAISFRAVFPNEKGLLRSGNSGRVRIPSTHKNIFAVPQESTFELQDKILVFMLNDSSQVVSRPIEVEDQNSNYYFVRSGIKPGDKLVYTGLSRLRDGMVIKPSFITMDSLRKIKPL